MDNNWSDGANEILSRGISLEGYGVNNWALSPSDALSAIEDLRCSEIPIVGVDVYAKTASGLKLTYDNWFYQSNQENNPAFNEEAHSQASKFIIKYSNNKQNCMFAIVPGL